MVVADLPARSKVGGITGNRTSSKGCARCLFDMDDLGTSNASSSVNRTRAHREQSLACSTRDGANRYKELGVSYASFNELPYFATPLMCPPDHMHAIHLGLCKRFFHTFLIEACGNLRGHLEKLLKVINKARLPSRAKRPDHRIGRPSGGNPNAEQWVTLFRHQLLFGLIDIWKDVLGGTGSLQLSFHPESKSSRRPVLEGEKPVDDIFEAAVLLAAIVDYMENDFTESKVQRLEVLITTFNRQQANLLGPGWLTINSHIAEHIPEFIKRYGARKYRFETHTNDA